MLSAMFLVFAGGCGDSIILTPDEQQVNAASRFGVNTESQTVRAGGLPFALSLIPAN